MSDPPKLPTYRPQIFDVQTLDQAKQIILTPEPGTTTEERWEKETRPLADEIARQLDIAARHVVLDYGAGIGRIAKELIARRGCAIVGADISLGMLQLAPAYVRSARFSACHPSMLDPLISAGLRFDSAYAVLVLQHCLNPEEDVHRIAGALQPNGAFFVANLAQRCVPTDQGWVSDSKDVLQILRANFKQVEVYDPGTAVQPAGDEKTHFFAICRL